MKRGFQALSILITGFFTVLISINGHTGPKRGGDYIAASQGMPYHFNAAIQSGAATAYPASQIFVSLVNIDENWKPQSYLAERWKVSNGGRTYTFYLKKGTVFHDGKPVTSEDVAFSLKTVKEEHSFGPYMFGTVKEVLTPDKHTVVIKLSKPHPALMYCLTPPLMPILPKHIYSTGPIRVHPANRKPIGSGPFELAEFESGKYYILKRFDKFMFPGRPYLDRIIIKSITSLSAIQIALKRGEVHGVSFISDPTMLETFKKDENFFVTSRGWGGIGAVYFLEFNLRNNYLKKKSVRQAIAYAIDLDYITEKLHRGFSKQATGIIHSSSPFHSDKVKKYDLDLKKANSLLDRAGYRPQSDGIRFSVSLEWFPYDPYGQRMIAEYMKPQLKKIGIDIKLKPPADFPSWMQSIGGWKHDLTMSNMYIWGDPLVGVHRLFRSDNIRHVVWTNTSGYKNRTIDSLFNSAGSQMNIKRRKALYTRILNILAEDLPVYCTHEGAYHTIIHRELKGINFGVWGAIGPADELYWEKGEAP